MAWLTKEQAVNRIRRKRWEALEQLPSLTVEGARLIVSGEVFELVYEDPDLLRGMVRLAAAVLRGDNLAKYGLTLKDVQGMFAYLDPVGQSEHLWEHCYRDYPHLTEALALMVRDHALIEVPEPRLGCMWPRELIGWQEIVDTMESFEPWFEAKDHYGYPLIHRVDDDWSYMHFEAMDPDGFRRWREEYARVSMLTIDGLLSRDVQ